MIIPNVNKQTILMINIAGPKNPTTNDNTINNIKYQSLQISNAITPIKIKIIIILVPIALGRSEFK